MSVAMKRKLSCLMMIPAITMGAQSALSQDDTGFMLEEIVVTATKRSTSEMDTPLSLEAVSGEDLEKANITDLESLAANIPSVNIADGLTAGSISIRGMGSGQDIAFEQSVAMFIDDVYMPRSRQYRAPFFDVERVEIMRGPQSVLFGLNATAGTVQIHSASTRPGDEAFVKLAGAYEMEYEGYRTDIVAGTSIGDDVGVRLAVRYGDDNNDFYENKFTGQDEGETEETVVRGTLVWTPVDNLTITSKLNYAEADMLGEMGELVAAGEDIKWERNTSKSLTTIFETTDPGFYHDAKSAVVNADYDIGESSLTAVVSYSESNFLQLVNTSLLSVNFFANRLIEEYEQVSGEIRWTSPEDRDVTFIAGLYAEESELKAQLESAFGEAALGGLATSGRADMTNDTSTLSPFVSATYRVSDAFRLTLGARYTEVEKDFTRDLRDEICIVNMPNGDGTYTAIGTVEGIFGAGALPSFCGTGDDADDSTSENLMPELIAQWDFSEEATSYLKIGKSVKSGGFSFSSVPAGAQAGFDDETAKSVEVGVKSRFMGGRAELNAAVFYSEFEDLQVKTFLVIGGQPISVVANAGETVSQGVEVEFNFAATEWLTVGTNVGYLDSTFDKFDSGSCNTAEKAANGGSNVCDKSGQSTPNAPEFSGAVYVDVAIPVLDSMVFTAGVNMAFSAAYFTEGTIDPLYEQDHYQQYAARIGLKAEDDTWAVSVVGKNLTDEGVNNFTQPFIGAIAYPGAPRTVTLQGTYNF